MAPGSGEGPGGGAGLRGGGPRSIRPAAKRGLAWRSGRLGAGRQTEDDSIDDHLLVRCVSIIGRVAHDTACDDVAEAVAHHPVRICATSVDNEDSYELSIEEDQLLAEREHDAVRVAALMRRVAEHALSISSDHLPDQSRPLEGLAGRLKEEPDES